MWLFLANKVRAHKTQVYLSGVFNWLLEKPSSSFFSWHSNQQHLTYGFSISPNLNECCEQSPLLKHDGCVSLVLSQGLANFFCKGWDSILGFAHHNVSITTTQLCCPVAWNRPWKNMYLNGCSCISPIPKLLTKADRGPLGPGTIFCRSLF